MRVGVSLFAEALDLAQHQIDRNTNALKTPFSAKQRHASISCSAGFLSPLLPDFDIEFSYSFDDEIHKSALRDRLMRSSSGTKMSSLSR